ncbi:hypothetical protein [Muricoccus radiodurans]|uniref:hypothetical protein n=1 Tax=Muricoccus radiodurans TaxID=2231721 RepID=UPI003CE9EB5A
MSGAVYTVESGLAPGWEEEFLRWQAEEHIPLLLGLPGYRAVTRFRSDMIPRRFLNLWEVDSTERFRAASHDAAVNTPWKARIVPAREVLEVRFYAVVQDLSGPAHGRAPAVLLRHRWTTRETTADRAARIASHPGTSRVLLLAEEAAGGSTLLHLATEAPPHPQEDGAVTDCFTALPMEER